MGTGCLRLTRRAASRRNRACRADPGDGIHRTNVDRLDQQQNREDGFRMTWTFLTRRRAMAAAGSLAAASRIARGQKLIGEPPGRIAPAAELVNAYEFEAMAQRKLGSVLSAEIAG